MCYTGTALPMTRVMDSSSAAGERCNLELESVFAFIVLVLVSLKIKPLEKFSGSGAERQHPLDSGFLRQTRHGTPYMASAC